MGNKQVKAEVIFSKENEEASLPEKHIENIQDLFPRLDEIENKLHTERRGKKEFLKTEDLQPKMESEINEINKDIKGEGCLFSKRNKNQLVTYSNGTVVKFSSLEKLEKAITLMTNNINNEVNLKNYQ